MRPWRSCQRGYTCFCVILHQLAAVAAQSQTWSHVQFAQCVPGDVHQQWEIDSLTEVTTITSAVDDRCLQAAECETSGEYARVHVDRCDVEYACGGKHTQWQPSTHENFLGFQNLGSTKTHMCLNNVGAWAPPDNKGPTWVCTWSMNQGDCSNSGDNSQYTYEKDKTIKSPNPRPADSCVGQDCCLTALPCVAPCIPPSSWGWTFIVLLGVSSVLYIGGGVTYNVKLNGMEPSMQALPNPEQWRAFYGFVADGIAYSRRQLSAYIANYKGGDFGGGDFGYTPVEDIATATAAARAPVAPPTISAAADPKSKAAEQVLDVSSAAPAPAVATKPAACPAPASTASTDSQTPLLASVLTDGNGGGGVSGSDEELVE